MGRSGFPGSIGQYATLLALIGLSCCGTPEEKANNEQAVVSPESSSAPVKQAAPTDGPPGMIWIPGGQFTMGALNQDQQAREDERPAHQVVVDGYWMDETEVTNAQFQEFVDATGYVTTAEVPPNWEEMKKQLPPGTPKPPDSVLIAASMVFTPVTTDDLYDWSQWWSWVADANWRKPQGPGSSIEDKSNHPVVQVSWDDTQAYLAWAGKRLPTES